MSSHIILVDTRSDWLPEYPAVEVVTAKEYLSKQEYIKQKGVKIINLCGSYRYLNTGYYCSLLAEARRHKVVPSIRTITDLSSKSIYSLNIEDLDKLVDKSMKKKSDAQNGNTFELPIFFGQCEYPELQDLSRQIFDTFPCPLIKAEFRYQSRWILSSIKPMRLDALTEAQRTYFALTLSAYLSKPWQGIKAKNVARYDIAILYNPDEKLPPSSGTTLQKFIKAGKKLGVNVELIQKKDFPKLAEFDALFIRETTRIDHYTYRFAKKAESEGMVVIDDPNSIVKCTNKVYLTELLTNNKIPIPKTLVLHKYALKDSLTQLSEKIGYPAVLKIPDGSFSRGVVKVESEQEAVLVTGQLFKDSDLILAQEYVYTPFDWRIGILNKKPIFACQYFMSKSHWQIVKHEPSGRHTQGDAKTFNIADVDPNVISIAVKAANLIGDGLYGVDMKATDKGLFVIEVNDNPNIDYRIEDDALGDELYNIIIQEFIRRLDL